MAVSKAGLKADRNYKRKSIRNISLSLNKTIDKDIIEYLDNLENKNGFLKEIIRKEIRRNERWLL